MLHDPRGDRPAPASAAAALASSSSFSFSGDLPPDRSWESEGRFAPFGILGGGAAERARHTFVLQGKEHRPAHITKDENVPMQPGDILRLETPGGGGYGNPLDRPPERVAQDVRRGYYDRRIPPGETTASSFRPAAGRWTWRPRHGYGPRCTPDSSRPSQLKFRPWSSSPPLGSGASGCGRWPSWWRSTPRSASAGHWPSTCASMVYWKTASFVLFLLGMLLVGATIVTQGVKARPGGAEIAVALGVTAAYLMVFLRMAILEERHAPYRVWRGRCLHP